MAFDVDDEQKQQNFQHDDFVSQSLRKRNEADGDLPASFCCLIASLLPLPLFLLYGGKWEDINEEKVSGRSCQSKKDEDNTFDPNPAS
ncbi:uncharacterized protein LOC113313334 isoform X1 [Papaver somniferum]|uniref:uncharacterized protein LOC113313334 isoform X1 n=1 Tax=Papaver somniferum TaxID=3469 RepID=UPI000E6FAE44|nr:uncharacterized protein LOC113313334 isoform X1 [Papaver somniferum]